MAETAQRDDEPSFKSQVYEQAGQVNDDFGFYQLTEAPSPLVPDATIARSSDGVSPRAFIDESSHLTTIPDPHAIPETAPWHSNLPFGDALAGIGGLFGAKKSFDHFGDEAEGAGEAVLDVVDGVSSYVGGVGSIGRVASHFVEGVPEWLTGMAGPSGDMLAATGSEAVAGSAVGAGAIGTGLGTVAALAGAFTGGYSVGSSADEYTKQSGVFGKDVGLGEGIFRMSADAGWNAEAAFAPGSTAGSVAGNAVHGLALAEGLSLGTLAAPIIAGAGLTHGLANTVATGATMAGQGTIDAVGGVSNAIDKHGGILPASMNAMASVFTMFCD